MVATVLNSSIGSTSFVEPKLSNGAIATTREILPKSTILVPGLVYDAGGSELPNYLEALLKERLLWSKGPYQTGQGFYRLLPTPILSDTAGAELWDQINRQPTYYQTDGEIELFRQRGFELANYIQPSTVLVDLGCGNVRKIRPLLDILEYLEKPVHYFALDLDKNALDRGLLALKNSYKYVKCFGLWGTFDSGLAFLNTLPLSQRPRLFLSLGSIFGNDFYHLAVQRLREWKSKAIRGPGDAMLLTMDGTTDEKILWKSYHDQGGLFERFIRNGYRRSNSILKCEWYKDTDWEHTGVINNDPTVHVFRMKALREINRPEIGLYIPKGGYIDCYEAFKYGPDMMRRQFAEAGWEERAHWKAPNHELHQYLITSSRSVPPMTGSWMPSL